MCIRDSGYAVHAGGRPAGVVTSGTFLPSLGVSGGMCMVDRDAAVEGTTVTIEIRGAHHEAILAARPLYSRRKA